jgi:hypothetical protein
MALREMDNRDIGEIERSDKARIDYLREQVRLLEKEICRLQQVIAELKDLL